MATEEEHSAEMEEEASTPVLSRLEALRSTLIRATLALLLAFGVCLAFSERVFKLLAGPVIALLPEGSSLVFMGLPDPFFMYLKVALIGGIFLSLPYVLYQVWSFFRPVLPEQEHSFAAPAILLAVALFYVGAAFAYFIVFPAAFKFFLSFETATLKPMIAVREYVSLIMVLMLAFGIVFETPIVVVGLGLLGILDSSGLKKGRRYFIVLAFIVGAILTPTPDPINQSLMAGPMILLYEIGIRILMFLERRRKAAEDEFLAG